MRERMSGFSAIALLSALSLSTFAYVTTENLPIGLLPLISRELHSTTAAVGLLVTTYGLVVVVLSIPLTLVTQRIDRRLLICGLMAVYVVGNAVSSFAESYGTLMAARIAVAVSQSLFWAVIAPATAGLFVPALRPRALSIVYAGSSVAALAGVPLGTWLGQQTSWRVTFVVLSGLGVAILATVAVLLPASPPGSSDADRGSAPDAGRYWTIVVYTALAVIGAFTSFTYISPFFTDVSGFGEGMVGPLLFVRGFAGLIGVFVVASLVARNGWLTMVGLVAAQAVALLGQWALGDNQIAVIVSICVSGFALAGVSTALATRALEVAPSSSALANAGTSTAFNAGITGGAFIGSLLLSPFGVRSTALVGALFSLLALVAVLAEPRLSSRRAAAAPALEEPAPR
ncbi:MFS transporter [Actinoplanes cyaneus]|uniref:MFS transporter n=1 Tax=Actinoplanes cyaneus TaxID=52696 RepID=A0A919IVL2_9ACTN|nr:MFS transporter [Actinoplanes cyaneus]MCW2138161.1 MFS transporter, DHA1 family, L-arabinose/isopropyl-beta-D-thiogalactopyranoside export protein/MFS transporter, DHA1 family, inner membrane transport protein [Actinoplanes cyaneus]GID70543.1 MFS transporter [Actinoplanes cyaneus]